MAASLSRAAREAEVAGAAADARRRGRGRVDGGDGLRELPLEQRGDEVADALRRSFRGELVATGERALTGRGDSGAIGGDAPDLIDVVDHKADVVTLDPLDDPAVVRETKHRDRAVEER